MNIETACAHVLGDETCNRIIASQGVHWAIVAAIAAAQKTDNPEALRTLRAWLAEQKEKRHAP